jgi:hypothetical protein
MTPAVHGEFPAAWTVRILAAPPMIAPARQFTYPQFVPGEEDTLARGAMFLEVKPEGGPNFLATCALGFKEPSVPSGVWTCPNPAQMLAVSGGYAYLVDMATPERCVHLPLKPAAAVLSIPDEGLIVLAGFHHAIALDAHGVRWTSGRLSWEGVTLGEVREGKLHGLGWSMPLDRELPFVLDLATGEHTGGGFTS